MEISPETVVVGYADAVARRIGQLGVRLLLAVCIGLCAFLLRPSWWPFIWFVAVIATQFGEHFFLDRPLHFRRVRLTPLKEWLLVTVTLINTSVYVSLSLFIWSYGSAGQLFATMLICGSLLHVCLHLYQVRRMQIAGGVAPIALLFGLPAFSEVTTHGVALGPTIVMTVASGLYLAHLLAGVRQNREITDSLVAANAYAESQQRRAEEESRSKTDFLATISHEIRTPLNAVTAASNLLKSTELSPRQKEYVEILLAGGEMLLGVVNNVLDMSKIEAGKLELELGAVDLNELAIKLTTLWSEPASAKGLSLKVSIDPETPPRICGDALRLSQVLFNLVSNAVKFTSEGSVEVKIRTVDDSASAAGRVVEFAVNDTGPGVSPEVADRIFESFSQADAGTTRRFGGTGLGLAISRRLAELMGGDIELESVPGQGSTFRLKIPLVVEHGADPAGDVVQAQSDLQEVASRLEILVAEDHEMNRRLLSFMLEPLGAVVTMVDNGKAAVDAANARSYDAILMDFQMPIMSGLEATRAIRTGAGPSAASKIIAVTANAFDFQRQAWEEVGADAFISKPFKPGELYEALAQCDAGPA